MRPRLEGPSLLLLVALAVTAHAFANEAAQEGGGDSEVTARIEEGTIDPTAMQALDRMGAYLRDLESFSLQADDTRDLVLESGQKIQLTKRVDLQVRKPDGLRADVTTDRKAREIYYDGKTFTLLVPETRFYASVSAPPTIGELLTQLQAKYDIEFPLVDLFHWGANEEAAAAIQAAMIVGTSLIDGQLTDHFAFRQADIDWQIWIRQGDAPLPLRYVIVTKDLPGEPQFMANLSWDTGVEAEDGVFTFTPSEDDHPIEIMVQEETQTTP